jgi:hypothetical protein
MVKPDFFGVKKETPGVITVYLPQASEEYGPISHYYLVVIPHANSTRIKHPDYYESADLIANSKKTSSTAVVVTAMATTASSGKEGGGGRLVDEIEGKPYITAKFLQRSLPYTFPLGDGKSYEGFENRPLERSVVYKIFVRAYVDVPQKHLYTSSPFSPVLTLNMPYGEHETVICLVLVDGLIWIYVILPSAKFDIFGPTAVFVFS